MNTHIFHTTHCPYTHTVSNLICELCILQSRLHRTVSSRFTEEGKESSKDSLRDKEGKDRERDKDKEEEGPQDLPHGTLEDLVYWMTREVS